MRKVLDGSRMDRGRKKRRNIKKYATKLAAIADQTMRRRILLTGGSGALSTSEPTGLATTRAAGAATAVFGGAGFAAGGVPAGVSTSGEALATLPAGS